MRWHNARLVLDAVREGPGISRAEVAARTGLAKATVSTLVDLLIAAGVLAGTGTQAPRGGRGRPGTGLELSAAGPHGLGVEIGVDFVATCLVGLDGRMLAHRVRPGDNRTRTVRQVLARVARAMETGLRDARERDVAVAGIGVAVPGLVDTAGVLRSAPNLGWRDVDLGAELARRVDVGTRPVRVGNEANFAARAELAGGELTDFVYVSGEIGIGAGIVLGGQLLAGPHGFAGELGHVCVDPDGPRCGCGARGCLEAVAGQDALLRSVGIPTDAGSPSELVERLAARLAEADPAALDTAGAAGRSLGIALAAVVNLVDVPAVVVGGSYARLSAWLAKPLHEELNRRALLGAVTVQTSRFEQEAAVYGAGAGAVHELLTDPARYLGS